MDEAGEVERLPDAKSIQDRPRPLPKSEVEESFTTPGFYFSLN